MKTRTPYVAIKTDSSFCPNCNRVVTLLCYRGAMKMPAFYICHFCEFIGMVGVGIVKTGRRRK